MGAEERNKRWSLLFYTIDSLVYKRFNEALRSEDAAQFIPWRPFYYHLMKSIRGLLDVKDTVYRGINGLPHLERYTDGSKIHWSGFSSTSSDATAAAQFAAGGGIVFVLKVHNAKDIRPFSWFGAAEGELLLSPNMEFLVTKELHDPTDEPLRTLCESQGCQAIEMRQIPSNALWS